MGCDINHCAPAQAAHTPLMVASEGGHANVVKCLMRHKADVTKVSIALSVYGGGADSQHGDSEGWTCLHFAAWHGQIDVCKLLVGGEPSLPLRPHHASTSRSAGRTTNAYYSILKLLILKDAAGRTASDLATFCGFRSLGKLLRSTQQLYAEADLRENSREPSAAVPAMASAAASATSATDTDTNAPAAAATEGQNSLLASLARERRARRREGSEATTQPSE